MGFATSPSLTDVLTDVRAFVQSILGTNVRVIQGIQNRAAAPLPQAGFVVLTPLYQERLAWNVDSYTGNPFSSNLAIEQSVRVDIQLDAYGPQSGLWSAQLTTLWRDDYACNLLTHCQPLYADEARMIPLVDSEQQYEQRWCIVLTAQYSPVTTVDQGYADALDIKVVDVQEAYPS